MTIAQRIKQLQSKGLPIATLAKICKVSENILYNIIYERKKNFSEKEIELLEIGLTKAESVFND